MTTWSMLPAHTTRRVNVSLAGAPPVTQDKITIVPVAASWVLQDDIPGRVLIEGHLTSGPGSRSGGRMIITFIIPEQPFWLHAIMAQALDTPPPTGEPSDHHLREAQPQPDQGVGEEEDPAPGDPRHGSPRTRRDS